MPDLKDYERRVAELERRTPPACNEDVYELLTSVFTARWTTAEEQDQAQLLICRLETLRKGRRPAQHGQG